MKVGLKIFIYNYSLGDCNIVSYILVDCFDTIFHRRNSNESTLYDWARELSTYVEDNVSVYELYSMRKKIEFELRNIGDKEEPKYYEIIEKLFLKYKESLNNMDLESFFSLSYEIDVLAEKKQLYLDVENIKKVQELKNAGNTLLLVSDFYLPKTFFCEILKYFKIDNLFEDIFVSSDIGLRKSTGNMYKYIINNYCNNGKHDMLMLGDNVISDVSMAKKYGIKTIYVPYQNSNKTYSRISVLQRYIHQSLKVNSDNELFIGFNSALLLFCNRLYKSALEMNCKTLLFCSREGQLLKQAFDIYQEEFCIVRKIRTVYFKVSRRATLLPSLKRIEEEDFERIFRQYNVLQLKDFLYSIGFSSVEISEVASEEERILEVSKPSESQFLRCFLNSNSFREIYEKKRTYQRERLVEYIREVNGDVNKIFLVDIGWKGTIQDNIYEMLEELCYIQGFYFGLYGYSFSERNRKDGLMFDLEQIKKNNSLFSYNHIKLESVFVADHGPVQYYEYRENLVEPVLSHNDRLELYKMVEVYQIEMIKKFKDVLTAIKNSPYSIEMLERFLAKEYLYFQCLKMPRYRKVFEKINSVKVENFGNISGAKESIPQNNSNIHRKQSGDFMYIDVTYYLLEKMHCKLFYPIAWLYCSFIYCLKRFRLPEK